MIQLGSISQTSRLMKEDMLRRRDKQKKSAINTRILPFPVFAAKKRSRES